MRKLTKIEQANADALGDAALFHVTGTILNKNIQDCNAALRDLLKREGVIDYENLSPGDKVTLKGAYSDGTKNYYFCVPLQDTRRQAHLV